MAPALPVFAGEPAPTGGARQETHLAQDMRRRCRSGFTREAGDAVHGTGCAGVRG
ncbi:diguanylate phosphodiesterase [Pseudomonas putida]|nr:diguanylate phosphodiesterase [Pseudomonas putida]